MLLALAVPTERLLGDGPALVSATERGTWFSLHLALQPLARLLSLWPSIGAERAWFLIAAACWAATYPVLSRLSLSLGLSRLASCVSALLLLASPIATLSATLPGPSAPALLGSAILFSSLIRSAGRDTETERSMGPIGTWFAVCMLDPNLVLLLPAVIWNGLAPPGAERCASTRRSRVLLTSATGLVALGALVLVGARVELSSAEISLLWRALWLKLLGTGSVGAPDSLTWLFVLLPALGVGVVGLIELFRRPTDSTESAPPTWIVAFAGVPLGLKLLGGSPNLDLAAWVLSPLIAVGLASFLARIQEERLWKTILVFSGVQIAVNLAFLSIVDRTDPNREWAQSAAKMLQPGDRIVPGDLVVTRNQQHDYLLHNRFKLQTVNLRTPIELDDQGRAAWWIEAQERVRSQGRAGGRVVVDWKVGEPPPGGGRGYAFPQQLHELVLLAPVVHLDPHGEKVDRPEDLPVTSPADLPLPTDG